jgi:bifunctional DNase/RNase
VSDDLVRVTVANVRVAVATSPGVEAGMVTLREDAPPHRSLSIVIGQPEARAILAGWTGTVPNRPSTWDLLMSVVAALEGRLVRAVITAVEEQRHFFATLELEHDGQRRELSARPSDVIAVAVRAYDAPIFVADEVMVAAGVLPVSDHSN